MCTNEKSAPCGALFSFILNHTRKPNSVLCNHLSRLCITTKLKRLSTIKVARPCIQIRILPFHFCISAKLTQPNKRLGAVFFRLQRLCSHLLDHSRRALPAILLHSFALGMFGLSTLLRARLLSMIQRNNNRFLVFCTVK